MHEINAIKYKVRDPARVAMVKGLPEKKFIEWLKNEIDTETQCLALPAGFLLFIIFGVFFSTMKHLD